MKTRNAILLAVALHAGATMAWAQADAKSSDKPASPGTVESISIDDLPLLDVVKTLARKAGVNILIDPVLTASTTPVPVAPGAPAPAPPPGISFRMDATPRNALDAVIKTYNLELIEDPKTGIATVTKKDPNRLEPLVSRFYEILNTATTNVVPVLTAVFANPARSKVLADARTGVMVVVATEKEQEQIKEIVARLDTPSKQVLIEARIMETSRNPRSLRGIDWAGTLEGQNFAFGNGTTTGTTTTTRPGATSTSTSTLPGGRTITTATTSPSTETTVLNTVLGNAGISANTVAGFAPSIGFLNANGISGVLSFLASDAQTEIISTPRSVMLDNETATLSVTRVFPIFEITPGTQTTPAGSRVTYTNVGTILKVTPRVMGSKLVGLKIVPEVSNVDRVDSQTINGQINTANVYAIRKIETAVNVPSGYTLVMGGLISDTASKDSSKVPFLGDIPGIGYAFRRDIKNRVKSTLLIFVTPTIVTDADYTPAETDFLKNKPLDKPDFDEKPWDTGLPYDWKKGVE
jgi:type II secretory pathway component GspD/PulD (secretin)